MRLAYVIVFLSLTACTAELWSPRYAQENIYGFYINPNQSSLLVSTDKHAYLFSIGDRTEKVLMISRRITFSPEFVDFKLDKEQNISGTLRLTQVQKELSQEEMSQLHALGFVTHQFFKTLSLDIPLAGTRYEVEGELPLTKLDTPHKVIIAQPDSFSQLAAKIIATPAAITIDTLVVVPAAFIGATIMLTDSL